MTFSRRYQAPSVRFPTRLLDIPSDCSAFLWRVNDFVGGIPLDRSGHNAVESLGPKSRDFLYIAIIAIRIKISRPVTPIPDRCCSAPRFR